jgi:hypothetical protein
MTDFIAPLVDRLSIADKNAHILPFQPNWAQRIYFAEIEEQMRANKPIRIINLKARQLGISTATEAFIYVMSFVIPNLNSLVIADEAENAQHLLGMTNRYWEEDPLRSFYRTRYQAKNTLAWYETNSSIRTTTAGNKKAGRSRTVQMLHASEVGFWMEARTVMTGLLQAIPDSPLTAVFLESTANGRGNYFHTTWKEANLGQNEYTPLFFPWWMHYEYRASHINLPSISMGKYDEDEKQLLELFKRGLVLPKHRFDLPPTEWEDALRWRRWAIRNKAQNDIIKFHQEYPASPEEAFVATGTNVFPQQHLIQCFKGEHGKRGRLIREGARVRFMDDIGGPLTIFRNPSPDLEVGVYSLGGDATATMRGDFAVGQVINRRSLEQVAVWRGRIDPAHFGEELAKLGIFYNTALLAPENEGPGYATVGWLLNLDYPNMFQSLVADGLPGRFTGKFGWSSSYRSKDLAIGWLLRHVIEHGITIHDQKTFDEMDDYVTLEGGGYGPGSGEDHDDTVMALAIAVTASIQSGPLMAVGQMSSNAGQQLEQPPVWESWGERGELVDEGRGW